MVAAQQPTPDPAAGTSDTLPISAITIPQDRLREDLGDIEELAADILDTGVFSPIVVDDTSTLLAGGRRLEAARHLGWDRVPVTRRTGPLSAAERLRIEILENESRKDFTAWEQSKYIARLAQLGREAAREEQEQAEEFRPDAKRKAGRPVKAGSLRDLEQRLGISDTAIYTAERHVSIVAQYPELKNYVQAAAFRFADLLSQLPTETQERLHGQLRDGEALHLIFMRAEMEIEYARQLADAEQRMSVQVVIPPPSSEPPMRVHVVYPDTPGGSTEAVEVVEETAPASSLPVATIQAPVPASVAVAGDTAEVVQAAFRAGFALDTSLTRMNLALGEIALTGLTDRLAHLRDPKLLTELHGKVGLLLDGLKVVQEALPAVPGEA